MKRKNLKAKQSNDDCGAIIDKFANAKEKLKALLVKKNTEIDNLLYCLIANEHIMLEGSHGTAKSMLSEHFFSLFPDAKYYSQQFMKGTQPDEVFGPMNSKKYREEAVWEYNINGKLPDCHFAFLDEVYRASDMLLPSMLQILNERKFSNGGEFVKCPLRTAVATCNFSSDDEELEAFHDRWLVRLHVSSLTNKKDKFNMLSKYLEEPEVTMPILSVSDLETVQKAFQGITIPKEIVDLYCQLVNDVEDKLNESGFKWKISDRRLCKALKLVKANSLLENCYEAKADALFAVAGAIVPILNNTTNEIFFDSYSKIVGEYIRHSVEDEKYNKAMQKCKKLYEQYDADMSHPEAKDLLSKIAQLGYAIAQEGKPISAKAVRIREECLDLIEVAKKDLAEVLDKK